MLNSLTMKIFLFFLLVGTYILDVKSLNLKPDPLDGVYIWSMFLLTLLRSFLRG